MDRVGDRIRQGLRRRDAVASNIDFDPQGLAHNVLGQTEGEHLEAKVLERDLSELHDKFAVVNLPLVRSPRRALAPLIACVRRTSFRLLSPLLERQSDLNGAVARSLSTLRNRSVRQQRLLRELTAVVPATRIQAEGLRELERRVRLLERDHGDGRPVGQLDNYDFANRFRGEEDSLRERQRPYLEFFADVRGQVLDLGCGRGEFLELLRDAGIAGHGVDLDRRMVEHCRAKGLSVELREGLDYLESLPNRSLGGIFASQIVEHMDLSGVLSLLHLAHRALAPGGVLLLDTHNPQTFFTYPLFAIDPTHVRLYHSETISWLFEREGFTDIEIRFEDPMMESLDLPDISGDLQVLMERLRSILHGYLTYAVIGRKPRA
jgi:SAM-dependent methyltransferase